MTTPTIPFASFVFGDLVPPDDDPAELYHEASKLAGIDGADDSAGVKRLLASPELLTTSTRAVRRRLEAETVELGPPAPLSMPLGEALARRRSVRGFAKHELTLPELAALLDAGYGVTASLESETDVQPLRAAPSGGGLYPLELSVAASSVDGLEPGLYHFDPLDRLLERVRPGRPALAALTPFPDAVAGASAVIVVSGLFWRSRFKYGLRGYRFVLLEAGHVAQNILLAATALSLGAVPLGGFYDRRVDALLRVNGVDESALYLICVGRPA